MNEQQIVTSLLQTYGSLGLVLIVAGYALRYVHNQLTSVQEKRIADAQSFVTKLLELATAQHESMNALTKAIDGNSGTTGDVRRLLEGHADDRDELRRMLEQALTERIPPRTGVLPPRR